MNNMELERNMNEWENSKISKLMKEVDPLSPGEKELLEQIKACLDNYDIKYSKSDYYEDVISFAFSFREKDMHFECGIEVEGRKVFFCIKYPFTGNYETIPLLCMFATASNYRSKASYSGVIIDVDIDTGEIYLSSDLKFGEAFVEKEFMDSFIEILEAATDSYGQIKGISEGKTGYVQKYFQMIKRCFKTMNGTQKNGRDAMGRGRRPMLTFEEFLNLKNHPAARNERDMEEEPRGTTGLEFFAMKALEDMKGDKGDEDDPNNNES